MKRFRHPRIGVQLRKRFKIGDTPLPQPLETVIAPVAVRTVDEEGHSEQSFPLAANNAFQHAPLRRAVVGASDDGIRFQPAVFRY
ncbi:hypothetical protein [Methylocaldum sp. 14B]|uniref:hypothetical protein n=1 Tax=Methylocaldum sp. 14B TaxID=1912213 RepID=UPI00098AA262|nr:hypothetical protein [Methylocaldum sp. 14B]